MEGGVTLEEELILSIMQGVIDNFLKPKFIELGMNATGEWLNSLIPVTVDGNGEIWGMDYTYWLANGRKPGTAPPISALMPWVTAKFGVGGTEARNIAFAIANKIKKEGTRFYPNGTDLLSILQSPEVINYIYSRMQQSISVKINELLIKQINDNLS